jgi:hypothetical protein
LFLEFLYLAFIDVHFTLETGEPREAVARELGNLVLTRSTVEARVRVTLVDVFLAIVSCQ